MSSSLALIETVSETAATAESSVTIDGVIDLPRMTDEKTFFDELLDAIIAYVEQHQGLAALSMLHQPYDELDDMEFDEEADDGGQDSEIR